MEANTLQAKDLRINNLLYYKHTEEIVEVELIHKKHFDCRTKQGTFIPNGSYEPIPLSEDWLLKLGFEKIAGAYILNNGDFEMVYNEDHISLIVEGQWLTTKINNVHNVQNLYYYIKGEELTIKDNV